MVVTFLITKNTDFKVHKFILQISTRKTIQNEPITFTLILPLRMLVQMILFLRTSGLTMKLHLVLKLLKE